MDPGGTNHGTGTPPLVGRDAEIALIVDQYKRAETGIGSVVLIRGEGGIGKSRLAAEMLKRAAPMGATILTGHATHFDRGLPYALVREIMASLPADLPAPIADRAGELIALLDFKAPALEQSNSDSHPRDVLSSATAMVGLLSEHEPLIMLWDDLHVADADSVSLFMRMARLITKSRVLFVGSMRPHSSTEIYELERLVDQAELEGRGTLLDVGPLDRSDTRALVANFLGVAPDQATVDVVFTSSRGNPFFATEATRSLIESSSIAIDGTRGRLVDHRLLRPRTALVHRFFKIGSTEARVAKILSAFGRVSLRELPLVASIASIPEKRVIASFDRLVAEQLLVLSDGRYEFAHSILREALYDDVGPAEQRRIHRIIADNLERESRSGLAIDITELATHLAESADPGDERSVAVFAEAGRATAHTAPLVSARWFSRCSDLLPLDSPERTTAVALQAASMFRASHPYQAARLGREALGRLPAGPARTRTLAATVNSLYICGELQAAIDVIDQEERRHNQLSAPLLAQRANLLAQLGRDIVPETDHARVVPQAGATELAITMTHDLLRAGLRGDTPTVEKLLNDLTHLCPLASRQTQIAIHGSIAIEAALLGHLDRAAETLALASNLRVHDRRLSIGGLLENAAVVLAFQEGRWDDALAQIPDLAWALDHYQARILEGLIQHVTCEIHLERGDLRLAADLASTFRWHIETVRPASDSSVGKVALGRGDVRGARQGLEKARERIVASGLHFGLDGILDVLIDACLADQDRPSAIEHLTALEAEARRTEWPVSRVRAQLARARVLRDIDASQAARETASDNGMRFHEARAQLIAGTLGDDARVNLTYAYRVFDELKALPWRQQAAAELRAHHLTVPRQPVNQDTDLSETESTLARLVSEGMTNREVANTLHYSVKTVEIYLTRLYAKTNCRSRLELARAVERGDISLNR